MDKIVNLIRGALIRGLPYRYFYKLCHLAGFLNTRRYWRIILHGDKIGRKIILSLLVTSFITALFALAVVCFAVALSHLSGFVSIVISIVIGVPLAAFFVSMAGAGFSDIMSILMTSKVERRWRAIVQLSTLRFALSFMDLYYREGRILDEFGHVYGLIDSGSVDLGYFYELFLPSQARFVSEVIWQASIEKEIIRFFYTGDKILKSSLGKELILKRVHTYLNFVKDKSEPAQQGFNGIWLQQGEAASSLYLNIDIKDYDYFSWYQVPCDEMTSMAAMPESYFSELYADDEPRYAWEASVYSYISRRSGNYIQIFKDIYQGYPRNYRVLKELKRHDYTFLSKKELPKIREEAADTVV
jgi:hypothetical protein